MAKAKFNYRPVYFISGMMALIVALMMVIPDPTLKPGKGPVEQRNLMVFFNDGVTVQQQRDVIEAGKAVVYRADKPGEYEVVLKQNQALDDVFAYFDQHTDVARVSKAVGKGLLQHQILLERDLMPEVER